MYFYKINFLMSYFFVFYFYMDYSQKYILNIKINICFLRKNLIQTHLIIKMVKMKKY